VPQPGTTITPAIINNTSSVTYLRKYALGAKLDDGLFLIMQSAEGREALREALLQSCFSVDAAALLREQSIINREAFYYSQMLEEKAHMPLVQEIAEADNYRPAARDQGFRRIVVKAYDHRCALCGVRIITPEQHTVVDAAHIVPWSRSQNDDIRNGMALCKLCHWAFDEGMMGVSDSYAVITSRRSPPIPTFPASCKPFPAAASFRHPTLISVQPNSTLSNIDENGDCEHDRRQRLLIYGRTDGLL